MSFPMSEYQPRPLAAIDAALHIEAADGEIVFIGPGAIAFAMTREAATQTAERLARVLAEPAQRSNGADLSPE
jgi:hypothetical protein